MNNNVELSRIKAMMNYGLQTEKKQYSSVEYFKEGADSKVYGIIREGNKYYIKVSNDKKNLVKENFDYIGGFNNRKNNEYSSYANALKQFDLKMMSLKEAYGNGKNIVIESWNPDKREELAVESTDKMRKEIMRQRQIMSNAKMINEGKDGCCDCKGGDPFCEKPCSCEDMEGGCCAEKNNVKKEFSVNGDSKQKRVDEGMRDYNQPKPSDAEKKERDKKENDDYWNRLYNDKWKAHNGELDETADKLGWHQTGGDAQSTIADTYMDTSNGTKIGSGAPFDKPLHTNGSEASNGVVEEGESLAYTDNQNSPSVGTGEIGDKAPFTAEKGTQLDEAIDDVEDDEMLDDEPSTTYDSEFDMESAEDDVFDDENAASEFDDEMPEDDTEYELETYDDLSDDSEDDFEGGDDVDSRLSSIEDTLSTILDKLNAMETSEFDDDDLYDDSEDDFEGDEDMPMDDEMEMGDEDMEMGVSDFEGDEDMPMDDEEDAQIFESRSYRKMRLAEENRLNMFGKHPAYRKHPMQLPPTGEDKNKWGRDWNDESVHSEAPYGEKIGSGAPFEIDPQTIENSIAECVKKILGQRKNLR